MALLTKFNWWFLGVTPFYRGTLKIRGLWELCENGKTKTPIHQS